MLRFAIYLYAAALPVLAVGSQSRILESPDKNLRMEFYLSDTGAPRYSLNFKQRPVILDSDLGFELRGDLHVSKIEIADGAIRKKES